MNFNDEEYFISGSKEDRVLNVWKVDANSNNRNAHSSFILSDAPTAIGICSVEGEKQLRICAACLDGKISFFETELLNDNKKPAPAAKQLELLERTDPPKMKNSTKSKNK